VHGINKQKRTARRDLDIFENVNLSPKSHWNDPREKQGARNNTHHEVMKGVRKSSCEWRQRQ